MFPPLCLHKAFYSPLAHSGIFVYVSFFYIKAVSVALRSKKHIVALLSTEQGTKMALIQGWLNK